VALLGLFWVLLPERASVAGNPGPPADRSLPTHVVPASAGVRIHTASPDSECRLPSRWILRWHWHRQSLAFFKVPRGDDPNDDETSDDPNDDDDAWDDLTCYYDMDVPLVACLPVTVPCAVAPERPSPPWTAPSYAPLLTGQRLRC
jgi:hypothetical protein